MTVWKLFPGAVAHVSTAQFHAHRERAPHLEQEAHRPRLEKAAEFACRSAVALMPDDADYRRTAKVSDLGCGDGGLLQLLGRRQYIDGWGYDFAPANIPGWAERGVQAEALDVFGADRDKVKFGDITVVTEVLEHLTDPFEAVRWIGQHSRYIVASSPWIENDRVHDECHAWAFDPASYRGLLEQGGYAVQRHELVGGFQVLLGKQR